MVNETVLFRNGAKRFCNCMCCQSKGFLKPLLQIKLTPWVSLAEFYESPVHLSSFYDKEFVNQITDLMQVNLQTINIKAKID